MSLWAVAPLFLFSGAAALIVETTWLRWFRLLFGATAPATSATLVAFFAGSALGAAVGARFISRSRRPLRAYAGLELAAAGACALVPLLLDLAGDALTPFYDSLRTQAAALAGVRLAIALAVSLPAAFCFGATWPAMASAAVGRAADLGRAGSTLAALNTAGAALGVAAASFWLPPLIGVNGTYAAGITLSLLAAAGALWLDASSHGRDTAAEEDRTGRATDARRATPSRDAGDSPDTPAPGPMGRGLWALAALSGFGHFAAQVLFVQAFGLVLDQSVLAFGAVLVCVLVALATAAAAVAWVERTRAVPPMSLLGLSLTLAALSLAAFPAALTASTDGLRFVGTDGGSVVLSTMVLVITTAGPALFTMGATLPLTFALAGAESGSSGEASQPGKTLGRLIAINTVGALVGALAGPYVLMPLAGLWGAFLTLAALYAIAAIVLRDMNPSHRLLRDSALAIGWVGVLTVANPLDFATERLEPGERIISSEVHANGIVSVLEKDGERWIRTDNHYALGGSAESVHEERQGHIPLLLHPAPRHVAFVGTATGTTAGAALAHAVESVHLVELVPGVAVAAERFFSDDNHGVYHDPRAAVVLDDARNFLAHTALRFDVIVADLFVPWRAGTGALYSVEHFRNVRERLRDGGLFCQWLPLYQLSRSELDVIAAGFVDVFPTSAVFRGDFYGAFPVVALVGWVGDPPAPETIAAAVASLGEQGERDRWMTHPIGFWSLYGAPLTAFPESLPRNLDGQPRIEFMAARGHQGGSVGRPDAIVAKRWVSWLAEAGDRATRAGRQLFPRLPDTERQAIRGGAALQLAGALYVSGEVDAAGRAFAIAADSLPPELVAEAEADPTVADLWHANE